MLELIHRAEKAGGRLRIVARANDGADSDRVRIKFLLTREARQGALAGGESQLTGIAVGENIGYDAANDDGGASLCLALGSVVGRDVGHLVREDSGDL